MPRATIISAPLAPYDAAPHEGRPAGVNKHSPISGIPTIRVYVDPNAVALVAARPDGRVDATPSATGNFLLSLEVWGAYADHGGYRRVAVGRLYDLWGAPVRA